MKTSVLVLAAGCLFLVAVALMLLYAPKMPESSVTQPSTTLAATAESYVSCGCGCCGNETAQVKCLDKLKDENIEDKIAEDANLTPEYCATVGCSLPVKYMYCD